jgi:SAM-dependent methyltransferase
MLPESKTQTSYNATYYEDGIKAGVSCYENYRWLPELTIPMCAEICERLQIRQGQSILDFGCAKGFMVKAFRLLHRNAWGYDISEYANDNAATQYHVTDYTGPYEWVIAKDVFEHLTKAELDDVLENLDCDNIFVVVPLGNGERYIDPENEKDVTHVIRETRKWWVDRLMWSFKSLESRYRFGHLKENTTPQSYAFMIGRGKR